MADNNLKINNYNLKKEMAKNCISSSELCQKAGICYRTYLRATNDTRCKPSTVGKIAKALNCNAELLIQTPEHQLMSIR